MSRIKVDVLSELKNWMYNDMASKGYYNLDRNHIVYQFSHMQMRTLLPMPREIKKSKEFSCPEKYQAGLERLEEAIKNGERLLPFMSRRIYDAAYDDKFIYDWGMFHFHIGDGQCPKDPRFVGRSDELVVAAVENDTVYFIKVDKHRDLWTKQELVRILADNWPEMMERYRIKGAVSLTEEISDADYKILRRANVNTLVDLHDGRVYIGRNYGLNTAGTSVAGVQRGNRMERYAKALQESIESSEDAICETIEKKITRQASYELNMVQAIKNGDYVFALNDGIFLRLEMLEANLRIIVGDSVEDVMQISAD